MVSLGSIGKVHQAPRVNCEGMTWLEWSRATMITGAIRDRILPRLRKAWQAGEDPAEWRAWAGNF